jgi:hypothetical protein
LISAFGHRESLLNKLGPKPDIRGIAIEFISYKTIEKDLGRSWCIKTGNPAKTSTPTQLISCYLTLPHVET